MKRILTICAFLCALILGGQTVYSQEAGTIISVQGEAWVKVSGEQWEPLHSGRQLQGGDVIKTGAKASVSLLNAKGTFMRIQGEQEQIYGQEEASKSESRWKTALKEFFGTRARKRIAATRGLDNEPNQDLWIKTMQQQLTEEDIESVLELATLYLEEKPNRTIALLWKLQNDFPTHAGIGQLSQQTLQGASPMKPWQISKLINGKSSPLQMGETLFQGNSLQIHYHSQEESYFYLFFTTQPQNGKMQTFLEHPSSLTAMNGRYFEARIPSKEQKSLLFSLDEVVGNENVWGWSCPGPVLNAETLEEVIATIQQSLQNKSMLSPSLVSQTAPAMCRSTFALSIKHR